MSAELIAAITLLELRDSRGPPLVSFAEPLTVEIKPAPVRVVGHPTPEGPFIDCAGNRIPAELVRTIFAR